MWLKAAVFIGGSMVIGAMCAHLSGGALAEETRPEPVEASKSGDSSAVRPAPVLAPAPAAPKAIPVVEPPVVVAPPEPEGQRGRGVSLSLPPGAGSLREQLAPSPTPPP